MNANIYIRNFLAVCLIVLGPQLLLADETAEFRGIPFGSDCSMIDAAERVKNSQPTSDNSIAHFGGATYTYGNTIFGYIVKITYLCRNQVLVSGVYAFRSYSHVTESLITKLKNELRSEYGGESSPEKITNIYDAIITGCETLPKERDPFSGLGKSEAQFHQVTIWQLDNGLQIELTRCAEAGDVILTYSDKGLLTDLIKEADERSREEL